MAELDLLGSILSTMERPPAAAEGEARRARGQRDRGTEGAGERSKEGEAGGAAKTAGSPKAAGSSCRGAPPPLLPLPPAPAATPLSLRPAHWEFPSANGRAP